MVLTAMTLLLMASMVVMLYYSRKAVKEEATQKAMQTLEGAVNHVDNIMLSVEQATGNIYFSMLPYLDNPTMMCTYARKLVETNPYVSGCTLAFKDSIYADSPATKQKWMGQTVDWEQVGWKNPEKGAQANEPAFITFSLPIVSVPGGKPVAMMVVDVSLSLLSDVAESAKPSANSYCALLDHNGTFIVHPGNRQTTQTTLMLKDQSAKDAAQAMMSGETGYRPFHVDGKDYYVFYKPFKRETLPGLEADEQSWSAGIVYPEDDIFGDYNSLLYYVLAIVIVGLLLSFVSGCMFIHWQLKPLAMLTKQAQRIAKGDLDEPIPDSRSEDEIGRLQANFKLMQQTLATNIGELEQLTSKLNEHGRQLSTAYSQVKKADRMKTAFLHNMTNQMLEPSEAIDHDVEALCSTSHTEQDTIRLADDIQQNGTTITELLKNLLNMSDEDIRKEVQDA